MLSYETIEPHTLELLRALTQLPTLAGTRLVGGTSLALQYGHRNSVDLDFFGTDIAIDEIQLRNEIDTVGNVRVISETKNIKCYTIDNIKIDIVIYNYPWISDMIEQDGLRLASPEDIGAMKINAIEGRGTKKDFIDLYFLLQHYSIEEILDFYKKKYPEHSIFRAMRSLVYFEDAEIQAMPKMFKPVSWEEMKHYIYNVCTNLI